MSSIIDFLSQPWPWYVAGPLLALVMFLLIYFGNSFGVSSNFRTACAIAGAGKKHSFFDINWKNESWNLVFLAGTVLGGIIASTFLMHDPGVGISTATQMELTSFGMDNHGSSFIKESIYCAIGLMSIKGWFMIVGGGFLVGFGSRYAGGCTSGHAISGLSNLQLPSLIAVIGFFIGGLVITYLVMPFLLPL